MTHGIVRVVRGRGAPGPYVPHIAPRPPQPLVGPPRLLARRPSHDRVGGILAGLDHVVSGPDLLIGIARSPWTDRAAASAPIGSVSPGALDTVRASPLFASWAGR